MPASKPSDAGAWLKVHPRLRVKLALLGIDEYVLLNKVWLYCQDAGNNGRFHVDELAAASDRLLPPSRLRKALTALQRPVQKYLDGSESPLWLSVVDDHVQMPDWWLTDNPGPEVWNDDTARWRLKRNRDLTRMPELTTRVKNRDRSLCRYCGRRVKWGDHKSELGATYDHVDPDGENTYSNVVVACRRDNGRKGDRTPEQWIDDDPDGGLSLLREGTTAVDAEAQRARARDGPPGGSTGVEPGSDLAPRTHATPHRVEPGSNRTGTDPVPTSSRPEPAEPSPPPPPDDSHDPGEQQ